MFNFLPKKRSQKEIRDWLINDLMGRIEPELIAENRASTLILLSKLSEEDLEKKLRSYEQALEKFIDAWPAYIEEQEQEIQKFGSSLRREARQFDVSSMEDIERQLSNFDEQ